MNTLHFSFALDVEDWMAFQQHFLQTSPLFKRSRLMLTWVLPVVILLLIAKDIDFANLTVGSSIPYVVLLLVGVAWIIFFPNFYFNRVLAQARSMAQKGDNDALLGQRELLIDDRTITQKHPGQVYEVPWTAVVRIAHTDQYFYVFNSKMSAVIVPLQKIKHSPDYAALAQLLTEHQQRLATA